MANKVITLDTPTDLSLSGVEAGLIKYREVFEEEPEALVVSNYSDYFLAQEIVEGGPIYPITARWMPLGLWMLVSQKGILYSGDI